MTSYNARVELTLRHTRAAAENLMSRLERYSPAVGRTDTGHADVVVTVEAKDIQQAANAALVVVDPSGNLATAMELMTTEAFDRKLDLAPIPELVSISEAAELLGVSRQAVLQRVESGSLPARKVGSTWTVPRGAVTAGREAGGETPLQRLRRDHRESQPTTTSTGPGREQ